MRGMLIALLLSVLGCRSGSADWDSRADVLAAAREQITERMRARWPQATPDEKQQWVAGVELIEATQARVGTASGGGDWWRQIGDAYVEAADEYAGLIEAAAPARNRNAQLSRLRELGDQLIGA